MAGLASSMAASRALGRNSCAGWILFIVGPFLVFGFRAAGALRTARSDICRRGGCPRWHAETRPAGSTALGGTEGGGWTKRHGSPPAPHPPRPFFSRLRVRGVAPCRRVGGGGRRRLRLPATTQESPRGRCGSGARSAKLARLSGPRRPPAQHIPCSRMLSTTTKWSSTMKRYLRLAGLVLALTPLAYPYGSLLEAAEASCKSPNGVRYHGGDEIILQGFHWNVVRTAPNNWYSTLASMAPSIAADGFSAIWMPVPWRDFSSWSDSSNGTSGGGEGYFWHDFNKNGRYGSDRQLKQAASALNGAGVKPIFDVVPNHMNRGYPDKEINLPAGQGLWRNDCADPGNYPNDCDDGDRFVGGDADLNTGHPQNQAMFQQEFDNLRNNYGGAG